MLTAIRGVASRFWRGLRSNLAYAVRVHELVTSLDFEPVFVPPHAAHQARRGDLTVTIVPHEWPSGYLSHRVLIVCDDGTMLCNQTHACSLRNAKLEAIAWLAAYETTQPSPWSP